MLSARTLFDRDGITIEDVACRHEPRRGEVDEESGSHRLVLVRRGCFVRMVDGAETLFDATLAYCKNPGEEQRYDHPQPHGDDCTALRLDVELVASLTGGDGSLPTYALTTSPRVDLEHRLLLASARRGDDPHDVAERAIRLSADLLERGDARRVASGRPATLRARRALADAAREALAADVELSLPELARALAVSPHHLSRVFRSVTGHTLARHRMRLRARTALECLAAGERNLGRLAAELGFADQSHLCRVVRAETGSAPSALRAALAA